MNQRGRSSCYAVTAIINLAVRFCHNRQGTCGNIAGYSLTICITSGIRTYPRVLKCRTDHGIRQLIVPLSSFDAGQCISQSAVTHIFRRIACGAVLIARFSPLQTQYAIIGRIHLQGQNVIGTGSRRKAGRKVRGGIIDLVHARLPNRFQRVCNLQRLYHTLGIIYRIGNAVNWHDVILGDSIACGITG